MKVIHICTNDTGGAGLCCRRISHALTSIGIDSKVLVLYKSSNDPSVYSFGYYKMKFWRLFNKIIRILGLEITYQNKVFTLSKTYNATYTIPTSIIDITKSPLVEQADIVHLHWVSDFVDIPSFFKKIKKPIVWTLHDENLFYGIAHYGESYLNNQIEKYYYGLKFDAVSAASNLGIVFLSQYFHERFSEHAIIANAQKTIIHNPVDCDKFIPLDKLQCRNEIGLSANTIVFTFIAACITDERKGLSILMESLEEMNLKDYKILAIGNNKDFMPNSNVISTGSITSYTEISKILSASDYLVMPSKQEAFAQAPLEAMSCGIPVVAFPVSGTTELINEQNGVICKSFDKGALIEGLRKALNSRYDRNIIREYVRVNFNPQSIAKKYCEFYTKLIFK